MSAYDPTSLEGVPEAGRGRLEQNKRGLFTSDLSVAEFLLVKEAGFDPLGLVVGSSIFHIGFQQSSWKKSEEMVVLSQFCIRERSGRMVLASDEAPNPHRIFRKLLQLRDGAANPAHDRTQRRARTGAQRRCRRGARHTCRQPSRHRVGRER